MSWAEDEGYDGYDFDYLDEWPECEICNRFYPPDQDFCYFCLTDEEKWKLGVL